MVNSPIGELIAGRVREAGVIPYYKMFEHDGVRGPNMATVYSDRGFGVRAPVVFYNRANEAAASLKPGDFDWSAIFARGVRWFHSGGIFASLSESTTALIHEAMAAARAARACVSFDLNYRPKLWQNRGGEPAAVTTFRSLAKQCDVLFGLDHLGISLSKLQSHRHTIPDPDVVFETMATIHNEFPNLKMIAATLRVEQSANRHSWAAALASGGQHCFTPTLELDVLDRIGGGDGFAAGLIFGLLDNRPLDESLRLGWAHGALLTTYPGDVTMARTAEVETLAGGGNAKVQR
jgi:2-dehydro-3-deoxygluconokinase